MTTQFHEISRRLPAKKRIALIAHDECKDDLVEWTVKNKEILSCHELYATGTTGHRIAEASKLSVTRFLSGPLGGDQQLGAKIAEGVLDVLVFFWDPLTAHPHDPDVKALLRIAALYNIVVACDRATADFVLSSPLLGSVYEARTFLPTRLEPPRGE